MYFTKKSLYYYLAGTVFILFFSPLLTPAGAFGVFNLLFVSALLVDFFVTPGKNKIRIRRIMDSRLSLGTQNAINLEVSNLSSSNLKIFIKDEYPDSFEIDSGEMEIQVPPNNSDQTKYNVKPTRRGAYKFGKIHVRVQGLLEIVGRQFSLDSGEEVRVYPNIKEISRYQLLARKGRLMEVGLKVSKVWGMGTDFESLREYQPDDEYRKINWKATARRSRLVTTMYEEEKSQNIFIVIEAGRMMTSKIDNISKFDYVLNSALLLAYVAMEKGDNVGMMVFSQDIKTFIPARRGKKQLNLIIDALYNIEPEMVEPDYGKAIRYLSIKNRKRSLVVFFTDLIDTDVSRAIVTYTRALYPAHLPLCVAVSDPALLQEADQWVDSDVSLYRKVVAEDLLSQREGVKTVLQKGGVRTLDVPPSQLTPSLISRYLSIKARSRL